MNSPFKVGDRIQMLGPEVYVQNAQGETLRITRELGFPFWELIDPPSGGPR